MLEKLKGYKTFIWAIWPTIAIVIMESGIVDAGFKVWVEAQVAEYWIAGVGIYTAGVLLLRSITNTTIFKKTKEEESITR